MFTPNLLPLKNILRSLMIWKYRWVSIELGDNGPILEGAMTRDQFETVMKFIKTHLKNKNDTEKKET